MESATQFWMLIAGLVVIGIAYFKVAREAIKRIMRRKT